YAVLSVFLLTLGASNAVVINEIMYYPESSQGSSNEWVELYNPENVSVDVSSWKFNANTLPKNTTIAPAGFLILAKDLDLFSTYFNASCQVIDAGFASLSNEGKHIFLNDSNGTTVDDVNYTKGWGANGTGDSLQKVNSTSWCAAGPTPGAANNCSSVTSATNTTINTTAGDCDLSLNVSASKTIYYNSESIDYDLIVSDLACSSSEHNYTVNYRIEDLFGNFLRTPYDSTYSITCKDTSSHTKKTGEICGTEAYLIKAEITDAGCNDTNLANNYDEFLIVVRGKNPVLPECGTSSSTSTSTSSTKTSSTATAKNFEIRILEVPAQAVAGENFSVRAVLANYFDVQKTFDVYSYVYHGNVPLTEGGWTGNKQNVTVDGLSSAAIELTNALKWNITSDGYDFRVRAAIGEEKSDANSVISIIAGNSSEPLKQKSAQPKQAKQATNKTASKAAEKSENLTASLSPITGAVVWASDKMQSSSVAMLLFISVLMILVIALLVSRR
ncbi:MAG: lamin tail domain-containing protein, partial [archaeon]